MKRVGNMKLIDIEKFDNSKPQLYSDDNYISIEHDICEKMYEFAGVEAIPIEWIEHNIPFQNEEYRDILHSMIDVWRKENEERELFFEYAKAFIMVKKATFHSEQKEKKDE